MKHDNFKPWMVGKPVMEDSTGDIGLIVEDKNFISVNVLWKTGSCEGELLHISLEAITFLEDAPQKPRYNSEIIIDGIRYKLTPIED